MSLLGEDIHIIRLKDITNVKVSFLSDYFRLFLKAYADVPDKAVRELSEQLENVLGQLPVEHLLDLNFKKTIENITFPIIQNFLNCEEVKIIDARRIGNHLCYFTVIVTKGKSQSEVLISLMYHPKYEHIIRKFYSSCPSIG